MSVAMNVFTINYAVTSDPIGDSGVMAMTKLFVPEYKDSPSDVVCFVGCADGLGADIASVYGGGGSDCTNPNGCGVHIHSGTDCTNSTTQGGHWYGDDLAVDPWAQVGYLTTDEDGFTEFGGCVYVGYETSPANLMGKAFIVHNEDGSRAACGLIKKVKKPKGGKAAKKSKSSKSSKRR